MHGEGSGRGFWVRELCCYVDGGVVRVEAHPGGVVGVLVCLLRGEAGVGGLWGPGEGGAG